MARRAGSNATTTRKRKAAPSVKPPVLPDASAPKIAESAAALPETPEPGCSHSWLRGRDAENRQHHRCRWCGKVVPR